MLLLPLSSSALLRQRRRRLLVARPRRPQAARVAGLPQIPSELAIPEEIEVDLRSKSKQRAQAEAEGDVDKEWLKNTYDLKTSLAQARSSRGVGQRSGARILVTAFEQAIDVEEERFMEGFDVLSQIGLTADEAQENLRRLHERYKEALHDETRGFTAMVDALLRVGLWKKGLENFNEALKLNLEMPCHTYRGVLRVLGGSGQVKQGIRLIKSISTRPDVVLVDLFNALLRGNIRSGRQDMAIVESRILDAMAEAGVAQNSATLATRIEGKQLTNGLDFLMAIGNLVVQHQRKFGAIGVEAMVAISSAHLRSGDVDAAYQWFLGCQEICRANENDRHALTEDRGLEYLSELVRALAVNGQACLLRRVLDWAIAADIQLPVTSSSVSLAGYTCGRTLATVWMEPPAEVIRRRSIWADQASLQVKCAERSEWERLDRSRHEMYQWYPYLAPDTRPERAWLSSLRAEDRGALGLVRDLSGESPAAIAARERLGDPRLSSDAVVKAALERSLRLDLPSKQVNNAKEANLHIFCPPETRTWRAHHADSGALAAGATVALTGILEDLNVRLILQAEREEDGEMEGSAEDELVLAISIAKKLQRLGLQLTAPDRRALLEASHALGNPELATAVLDEVAEQVATLVKPTPPGAAMQALTTVMEESGWEPESTKAFWAGQRLLPRRSGEPGLGSVETRYIDPLMGAVEGLEHREKLLESLMDTLDSGPAEKFEVELGGLEVTLTRQQVLTCAAAMPKAAAAVRGLASTDGNEFSSFDFVTNPLGMRYLQDADEDTKVAIARYIVSVLEEAERVREKALDLTEAVPAP